MATKDLRIDAYINRSAEFAQPILMHLREAIHKACPEVQETVKWGFPHFDYGGSILCSMASFKQHCSFGFWLSPLMKDSHNIFKKEEEGGMGQLGQIKSLADLPSNKVLSVYIKEAMALIDKGVKLSKKEKIPAKEIECPPYFLSALKGNKKALAQFEALSPSNKKEYIQWISGAKTEATREKRMATALEWIAEGKSRNWKYER